MRHQLISVCYCVRNGMRMGLLVQVSVGSRAAAKGRLRQQRLGQLARGTLRGGGRAAGLGQEALRRGPAWAVVQLVQGA